MKIAVIGSLNIDYVGTTSYNLIKGESHPGSIYIQAGGVARNIVENLARMEVDVTFFTAVGKDYYGQTFKQDLENIGVKFVMPIESKNYHTSIYFAINNNHANMEYAIVNTDILKLINVEFLSNNIDELNKHEYVLLDTNISQDAIDYIFSNLKSKIIVDAVSLIKSEKLISHLDKIYLLKVNNSEYKHLENYLIKKHPQNIIATNGSKSIDYMINNKVDHKYTPIKKEHIVSTTGAGDSLLAGTIYNILSGKNIRDSIKEGLKFSYYTLDVIETVNKNIKQLIEKNK